MKMERIKAETATAVVELEELDPEASPTMLTSLPVANAEKWSRKTRFALSAVTTCVVEKSASLATKRTAGGYHADGLTAGVRPGGTVRSVERGSVLHRT